MKNMPAGAFKTNCLAVMDEVKTKRQTVLITKHGQPVAKLVPVNAAADEIFGFYRGKGAIVGDVLQHLCRDDLVETAVGERQRQPISYHGMTLTSGFGGFIGHSPNHRSGDFALVFSSEYFMHFAGRYGRLRDGLCAIG